MLDSVRQGIFFGLHSGIITTAGLLFGLGQTKNLTIKYLTISIVSLAIADGFSEAYVKLRQSDKIKSTSIVSRTVNA